MGALVVLVALAACSPSAPGEPEPDPTTTFASPGHDVGSAEGASESAEPETPAEPPEVEGEWEEKDTGPMTSEEAIDAADLPAGLKAYLKEALLQGIDDNEEYADEFPNCPVEAQVTALHPAGFAVGSVLGCGPDGPMGVFAGRAGAWREVVRVHDEPECSELAELGIPAGVPVTWDQGLRCGEGGSVRYW